MRRIRTAGVLMLALLLLFGGAEADKKYHISKKNNVYFGELLARLLSAYEDPAEDDEEAVEAILESIRAVKEDDYDIARSIADHWKRVYLDEDYMLCLWQEGEETAGELEAAEPEIGEGHAFVVLGYELREGKMQDELKGRCRAAAAAAKSYPQSRLICSGGATGSNNPDYNTEAGLMKQFLVHRCGIDGKRIITDTRAMSTLQNAENTFSILRKKDIREITIVTSSYHQRWGQAVYNAMAAMYAKRYGFTVRIVGNYCYETDPPKEAYRQDARMAMRQISEMLNLPKEATKLIGKPRE